MSAKAVKASGSPLPLILPACLVAAFLVALPATALQDAQEPVVPKAQQDAGPAPQQNAGLSPQQEFQALLERVKKSDSTVDFGRLRHLQTQLDGYDPYDSETEDHPFKALRQGDLPRAKELAETILARNYLDLESHTVAAAVAEKSGNAAEAAHHRYVVKGILDSILRSGDGQTPDTAYQVVSISEEYAIMGHLGLHVASQSLLHSEGHSYDLLKGTAPQSQTAQDVYFNIDPIMAALDKKLSG
jgi:hypothetical protein